MAGEYIPIYGSDQYPHVGYCLCDNPEMDISQVIASNLSAWMEASPSLDTLKKVAAKSKVGFGTVQRARNGDGNITVQNLEAIARAFGRRAIDLLTEDKATYPGPQVTVLTASEPSGIERRLLDGYRHARPEDQEIMLLLADRALSAFDERTGRN